MDHFEQLFHAALAPKEADSPSEPERAAEDDDGAFSFDNDEDDETTAEAASVPKEDATPLPAAVEKAPAASVTAPPAAVGGEFTVKENVAPRPRATSSDGSCCRRPFSILKPASTASPYRRVGFEANSNICAKLYNPAVEASIVSETDECIHLSRCVQMSIGAGKSCVLGILSADQSRSGDTKLGIVHQYQREITVCQFDNTPNGVFVEGVPGMPKWPLLFPRGKKLETACVVSLILVDWQQSFQIRELQVTAKVIDLRRMPQSLLSASGTLPDTMFRAGGGITPAQTQFTAQMFGETENGMGTPPPLAHGSLLHVAFYESGTENWYFALVFGPPKEP